MSPSSLLARGNLDCVFMKNVKEMANLKQSASNAFDPDNEGLKKPKKHSYFLQLMQVISNYNAQCNELGKVSSESNYH